jgi:pSer/pThr/pTyr-binding forkhead associated (FHA) protein
LEPVAKSPLDPHVSTPAELKARIEAERLGTPFLVYRDGGGGQAMVQLERSRQRLTVGRRADCDVPLVWDGEVSRLHAQLEHVGPEWTLVDDGLSRNGSFVNGRRVTGHQRLKDGDRLCFGVTPVVYRAPAESGSMSTQASREAAESVHLSPTQRSVLVALCRPLGVSAFEAPATNKEIADELHLTVDAVKAHLRVLFERFALEELPQNQKRARLAGNALVNGIVAPRDL